MGIFSSIANAIFGSGSSTAATRPAPSGGPAAPGSGAPSASSASTAPAPISRSEVEAQIAAIEARRGVKYNWKQSIVDLMKLLDLDSSLASRKELAQELGYKGALDGSAEMNIWLHKQVMERLAEGGGKIPESLKG
ncbi:MAG: DUF3597 domain-containing protein [Alphaproteobacteria bacterium]|nr:MAG: DUF3597 domain-containing protein [Alphaproteobacteria bacterium]